MIVTYPAGFIFYFDQVWIDAEHERCRYLMHECPHVPVASKQTLELYAKALHAAANAEARLAMLRQAILADMPVNE